MSVSNPTLAAAISMVEAGERTLRQIADDLGVKREALRLRLKPTIDAMKAAGAVCRCGQPRFHRDKCRPGRLDRHALYQEGLTDAQIADRMNCSVRTVSSWRLDRKLPCNPAQLAGNSHLTPAQHATRKALYDRGYSDQRIAEEQGVTSSAVFLWRRRAGFGANFEAWSGAAGVRRKVRPMPTPIVNRDALFLRIRASVPRWVSPALRDDIISEIYVAVLDGTLPEAEIERSARRFVTAGLSAWESRFGPRSLDEKLGDDDDLRLIDLVRDERSSSWLEEMGATAW